jgi:tetratricopeptide (TPR) repeat protein
VIENGLVDAERALEQGRGAYAGGDWPDAFDALGRAHREQPLAPEDLELLARSAYMLGLDDEYRGALEQAYHAYHDAADALPAARCAWWIGHNLLFLGQSAPARGWFARGQRLLEREDRDSVERGYLDPAPPSTPGRATSLLRTRPPRKSRKSESGSVTRTSWRSQ